MSLNSHNAPSPDDALSVSSRILAVPKGGASMDEYEDAAVGQTDAWPVRAAVADGATESAFARSWAETLVDGVTSISPTPEALAQALPEWQRDWTDALDDRTTSLPWYAAAKAREGAFATVLGLELRHDGSWQAVSVGDSLLIHLRASTRRRTWPYTAPDDFTNRPALLPSRPDRSTPSPDGYRATTGTWQAGDVFLLATDAVAAWLLRDPDESPTTRADPMAAQTWSQEIFREAVSTARADGHLRNDDCTLLVLEVNSPPVADGSPRS